MLKRIVLAGILGGCVMFAWESAAHVSPLGQTGIDAMPREFIVVETLVSGVGNQDGLYRFPASPTARADAPSGLLLYHPANVLTISAAKLAAEFGKEIGQSLLLAFVLSGLAAAGFLCRLGAAAAAGAIAATTTNVSLYIWYGFPVDYLLTDSIIVFIGFVLAGAVILWIVPPHGRKDNSSVHA